MKQSLEIYYPIVGDYNFEIYDFSQRSIIVEELNSVLSKFKVLNEEWLVSYSIVAEIKPYDSKVNVQNTLRPYLQGLKEKSLKFSIEVDIVLDNYIVTLHSGDNITRIADQRELLNHLPYSLTDIFGNHLFEIIILSQISRPGSLKIREGIVYINGHRFDQVLPQIANVREELEVQQEINYPDIQYLNFGDYFNWIINNNLLFPDVCVNHYQKALVNLTYVFSEENRFSRFIFQMRILEMIYTSNTTQIAEQLNSTIQFYLGELTSFKKRLKQMYNVRSKFLHGKSGISPLHKSDYEIEEHQTFEQEFHEASTLSILLIISTLQKMYIENRKKLNFKISLE